MNKNLLARIKQYLIETGYDDSTKEHWKLLAEAMEEIAGLQAYKQHIEEALNSGDGVYRP